MLQICINRIPRRMQLLTFFQNSRFSLKNKYFQNILIDIFRNSLSIFSRIVLSISISFKITYQYWYFQNDHIDIYIFQCCRYTESQYFISINRTGLVLMQSASPAFADCCPVYHFWCVEDWKLKEFLFQWSEHSTANWLEPYPWNTDNVCVNIQSEPSIILVLLPSGPMCRKLLFQIHKCGGQYWWSFSQLSVLLSRGSRWSIDNRKAQCLLDTRKIKLISQNCKNPQHVDNLGWNWCSPSLSGSFLCSYWLGLGETLQYIKEVKY